MNYRERRDFAVQKETLLRVFGDDMLRSGVITESSGGNTPLIALDSDHGVM